MNGGPLNHNDARDSGQQQVASRWFVIVVVNSERVQLANSRVYSTDYRAAAKPV